MAEIFDKAVSKASREGVLSLSKSAVYRFLWRFAGSAFAPVLANRFVEKAKNVRTIDQSLDFVFAFKSMGVTIAPLQVREEIHQLLEIVDEAKPHVVMEIGTANGGTLFLFTRVASENALIISVDLPEGPFGGGYPIWKSKLYRSFAVKGQRIDPIRADSHKEETFHSLKTSLDGRMIDFLFIDGDHSYDGVKRDFETYSSLVRKGGIIAFHDICQGPEADVGGVPRFWREVSSQYHSKSLIKDIKQAGFGIGVLHWGKP